MKRVSRTTERIQGLVVGATGTTAIYHFSHSLGIGLDKETVGYLAPWISYVLGWIWIVFHQETIVRFNVYQFKRACRRRMEEITRQLEEPHISDAMKAQLRKEYQGRVDAIAKIADHDLERRFAFAVER